MQTVNLELSFHFLWLLLVKLIVNVSELYCVGEASLPVHH
jgi:hypothetical protein